MEDLNIISGVLKQDKHYLFNSRVEKELDEIKVEKNRLDKEVQKYDNIVAILERMPNELSWQLPFLPVTNHAFFPGATLNNTNEVQVHIGDGWFTRCSAHHAIGICHRRQDKCRGTKQLLEEREQLLLSWLHAAQGKSGIAGGYEREEDEDIGPDDAFTADEVVEYVTEEQYLSEKETHKQKVTEYYLKQRAMIKQQQQQEMSNDELWSRLEVLEMEEKSSGELRSVSNENRAATDTKQPASRAISKGEDKSSAKKSIKGKVKFAESENNEVEAATPVTVKLGWDWNDEGESESEESSVSSDHSRDDVFKSQERPHKLAFADHIKTGSDETSVIEFAHTPVDFVPASTTDAENLKSPSDIYATYQELFAAKTAPKSILKRRSQEGSEENWPTLSYPLREYESDFSSTEQLCEQQEQNQPRVLLDIIEKQDPQASLSEIHDQGTKMSKFKSARMASKISK